MLKKEKILENLFHSAAEVDAIVFVDKMLQRTFGCRQRENEEIRAGETGAYLGTHERHLCVSTTELEITPSLCLLWLSDI